MCWIFSIQALFSFLTLSDASRVSGVDRKEKDEAF